MEDFAGEFMSNSEMRKRIKSLVGRGTRLNLDIDEVRHFNPRLSNYIVRNPIEAISIFERILNQTISGLEQEDGGKNSEKTAA